ncbi:MAG: N-acetylmuramic acid 6-phosphate etherase [Actinomycetota bacterium]|nr:N-acetylmuramic acid 6-phosphate etherase [Actinomycetota bacterium]
MPPTWFESPTEDRNPRTTQVETLPTLALLETINDEDATVAAAVRAALPALSRLVDETVRRVRRGGRVHYFGAGTSGRLGLLDAAELIPTFGVSEDLVVAHLAGGDAAMRRPIEGAEDDRALGVRDAQAVGPEDVAVGLTASGRTPYVGAALRHAGERGACTALVTANPRGELAAACDIVICADTGPEVIAGSTRMKAGTAEKLVLNSYSTAVMVRLGMTWSNLMVNMRVTNAKLRRRALRLLHQATGVDLARCEAALEAAGGEAKVALVSLMTGASAAVADQELRRADGVIASAIERLGRR